MVLESINALQAGFEGCEKKLEVDFEGADLRTLPQSAWVSILKKAQCTIINRAENEHFISFVLSESSLFVFPHKVILKTCGTTSLLFGLPKLLEVAEGHGATPNYVQFSRSNFMFPDQQPFPHESFDSEVLYLNKFLQHGQPYILGPLDGPRWNIYIADFDTSVNISKEQTLELIMFNLDPEKMKPFYRLDDEKDSDDDKHLKHNGRTATKLSGIDMLIEGATVDSHLFSPCGYSCNGLKDEAYFTIHVTPEPECSFVSFETNVRMTDYSKLVRKVLDTFSPASFSVYCFVDSDSLSQNSLTSLNWDIDGFNRTGHTYHDFEGMYNLSVGNFEADDEAADAAVPPPLEAVRRRPPQYGSVALEGVPKATRDTMERLEALAATAEAAARVRAAAALGGADDEDDDDCDDEDAKFDTVPKAPKTLSDDEGGEGDDDYSSESGESVTSCASQNPECSASNSGSSDRSVSPPSTPTSATSSANAAASAFVGGGDFEDGARVMLDYKTSCGLSADVLTSVVLAAVQAQRPVHTFDEDAEFGSVVGAIIDHTDTSRAFFVVDLSALVRRFVAWAEAMPRVRPFYAIQCNSDPALILAMNALGCGFSGPSMRQVDTLLSLGVQPSDILFSNPWPSMSELRLARERNIGFLAFDNQLELRKISVHCPGARLFVMVAPQLTHGRQCSATSRARARPAYGTSLTNAFRLLKLSQELPGTDVVGVMISLHDDCPPEEVRAAIEAVAPFFARVRRELGINLRYLHLGSKGWDQRAGVAGAVSPPSVVSDVITPALTRHFPASGTSHPAVEILAEPSPYLVESAYSIVVSLLSIRSEAVPLDDSAIDLKSVVFPHSDKTPPGAKIVDYKLYFDYYVDDGIYRSFPFLKRRRAELVPHVVRRPLAIPEAESHYLLEGCQLPGAPASPPSSALPNPEQAACSVPSPVPSRPTSPVPAPSSKQTSASVNVARIVDALGAPVPVTVTPSSLAVSLFQSRIWGATCDGLDSICDSVLLPKLNQDDRLYFRDMGANTFAHATAFNGFGDLPPPHYVVFKKS